MSTKKRAKHNDRRITPRKASAHPDPKPGELCYYCESRPIDPYEVCLCCQCADELRFTPRLD